MEFKKLLTTIFLLAIMFSSVLLFAACTSEGDENPTELSETSGETAPEETTYPEFIIEVTYDDGGGRIYKTMPNYVFIPDEAIGVWKFVDIVQAIEDFDPDVQASTDYIGWHTNIFFDDGKMLMLTANFQKPITTETWTKGYIVLNQSFERHIMPYKIKQIKGDDFLFVENEPLYQNVDQPPNYYVFKRTSEKPELVFDGYEDVRNADLSLADFSDYPEHIILTFWFNEKTIFPPRDKMPKDDRYQPEYILEAAKNPGLGVRALHEQGITGKGVSVAIIDFPMFYDHPEYHGNLICTQFVHK